MLSAPLNPTERRLLNALRVHGDIPRHILAKHVGVTAQAIGQMVRKLDRYNLFIHHKAVKNGLGQPPKPLSINQDGAFSIGIKIGRRRTEVLLVDLLGQVRERHTISYAFPVVKELLKQIESHLKTIQQYLQSENRELIGVGVAAPFALGGWHRRLGLSVAQADEWHALDLQAAIQAMTPRPVRFVKDTAAACIAELLMRRGQHWPNFLYIFVDTFVGGGVVSQGVWLQTKHGNAGAVASVPLGDTQLLDYASMWDLEQRYLQHKLDPTAAYDARASNLAYASHTEAWLASASQALASSIVSGSAFLDCDSVVIDGSMSQALLDRLIAQIDSQLNIFNWEGLWRPQILAGALGKDAGALGGALLPLHEYFYA
jgi:predicted NBD/HSP70 family sugar kinase